MIESTNAVIIAEYRLLNACYLNQDNLDKQGVSEESFVHDQSKTLFNSIFSLKTENIPINENSLFQRASSLDNDISQEQIDYIVSINEDPNVNINDIVKTLTIAKNAVDCTKNLEEAKTIINSKILLSDEDKAKVRNLLYDSEEKALMEEQHSGVMNLDTWSAEYIEEFKKRQNGKLYSFNDKILDNIITTGPEPGCGGLICASSGMGKSSYCLNLINNFINLQVPCMYFSLEMGKIDTFDRLIAIREQVPFKDLVNPSDPNVYQTMLGLINNERQELIKNNKFRFCEDPSLTLNDIRSYIKKFQSDIGQRYCIVVLDLVTMVKDFASVANGVSLANQMEFAINKLNAMAKELGFHYIGVAQLNRTVESDKIIDIEDIDKLRPTRSAIKNSGALLERTRYCISLFRKKFYADTYLPDNPETQEMDDIIEVGLMKQNNGVTARKYARFDGDTFSITPVIEQQSDNTGAA